MKENLNRWRPIAFGRFNEPRREQEEEDEEEEAGGEGDEAENPVTSHFRRRTERDSRNAGSVAADGVKQQSDIASYDRCTIIQQSFGVICQYEPTLSNDDDDEEDGVDHFISGRERRYSWRKSNIKRFVFEMISAKSPIGQNFCQLSVGGRQTRHFSLSLGFSFAFPRPIDEGFILLRFIKPRSHTHARAADQSHTPLRVIMQIHQLPLFRGHRETFGYRLRFRAFISKLVNSCEFI